MGIRAKFIVTVLIILSICSYITWRGSISADIPKSMYEMTAVWQGPAESGTFCPMWKKSD